MTHLFFPEGNNSDSYCAYGAETSQPIGILLTDRAFYMYAFETAIIDSERFLRLWLLIYNRSDTIMEFDSKQDIKLSVISKGKLYRNIYSEFVGEKINEQIYGINNEKPFLERINSTLTAMNGQRKIFVDETMRFDLENGGRPWLGWDAPDEVVGGVNPVALFDIYTQSQRATILTKYTIYPKNGVYGSIFFPCPGINWKSTPGQFKEALDYRYELKIHTPSGNKKIVFHAH